MNGIDNLFYRNLVSVPFHQVVRAMTPVFTVLLSILFLQKTYPKRIYLSLLPVSTILASIKTIVTNRIQVGRLKLNPLDLLFRMSPLAFIQCIMYAYATGELERVELFSRQEMTSNLVFSLLLNGLIAFALNVVSFTANKKTSALTMTVAGNVKQVLSIILSVIIFDYTINMTNTFGIVLTLLGGAWYGYEELSQKKNNSILPTQLSDVKMNDRSEKTPA
ncbi:hypothetical protein G6F56_005464 [Rhizopus delemar]|nr:hypothetical protein G6F56_005464 [Rhizopus delemar]